MKAIITILQNVSFSIVSRSRNRSSFRYHMIASVFSNGVWFLTFRQLVLMEMRKIWELYTLVPYTKGGKTMIDRSKFPQTLNVTVENEGEGENEYLDLTGALESKGEIGKERIVAVYELKEIVVLTTKVATKSFAD